MAVVELAFLLVLHHEILTGNDIVFVAGGTMQSGFQSD